MWSDMENCPSWKAVSAALGLLWWLALMRKTELQQMEEAVPELGWILYSIQVMFSKCTLPDI